MNPIDELLILAIRTNTRLCFDGNPILVFPGKDLPPEAEQQLRAAGDALAARVSELFSFELSAEDGERIGREMYEDALADEAMREAERDADPDADADDTEASALANSSEATQ